MTGWSLSVPRTFHTGFHDGCSAFPQQCVCPFSPQPHDLGCFRSSQDGLTGVGWDRVVLVCISWCPVYFFIDYWRTVCSSSAHLLLGLSFSAEFLFSFYVILILLLCQKSIWQKLFSHSVVCFFIFSFAVQKLLKWMLFHLLTLVISWAIGNPREEVVACAYVLQHFSCVFF